MSITDVLTSIPHQQCARVSCHCCRSTHSAMCLNDWPSKAPSGSITSNCCSFLALKSRRLLMKKVLQFSSIVPMAGIVPLNCLPWPKYCWTRITVRIITVFYLFVALTQSHPGTMEGFCALIQKEWLSFGHKFNDRLGHGIPEELATESSPIFLQFLGTHYPIRYTTIMS